MLYMMIRIRGRCTTLTEPIVEGPALSIWPALCPGGVTAFPAPERSYSPGRQPIEKIMNAVQVSVVALEQSGKAHIRMLCEQRPQSFVHARDWDMGLPTA
jgi:hypothetical protein